MKFFRFVAVAGAGAAATKIGRTGARAAPRGATPQH